jgi:copper(I)-binding protein
VNAQPAVKRRIGIGLVAVCATLLTSACATGQQAQTANEVPAVDATMGDVGSMQLRNVAIKPPPNGRSYGPNDPAELQLVIVNTGRQTDTLTSVSTPAAAGFHVYASESEASAAAAPNTSGTASGSASASASASATGSASGSGSGSGSGSVSPSASSSASGSTSVSGSISGSASSSASPPKAPPSLAVAAGQPLSLSVIATNPVLVLMLTKGLFPGPSVPITFTFANAGSVTLRVPVQITPYTSPLGVTIPPISSSSVAD